MERRDYDAVVVGAGSAGSAAAWMLAGHGLRVALVERRAREHAGPGWHNAVPPWMLDVAGVPRPRPPERAELAGGFCLLSPDGRHRVALSHNPIQQLDMRRLVARLQGYARQAGVHLLDRVELDAVERDGDRPRALLAWHRPAGDEPVELQLRADLFVDASGLHGALRRRVPALARCTPPPGRQHVCVAAQQVAAVADPTGARAYLERHGARPGEAINWSGVRGGWSTLALTVSRDLARVDLLAGTTADVARTAPAELLTALRARERWIGPRLRGGAGPIPLRRPYDRLAVPGLALVGDAACQVFPAHGSGVGIGLIAARTLADAVGRELDPGSQEATWRYQARFQRRWGGLLAAYDAFRRGVQALRGEDLGALIEARVVDPAGTAAGLDERMPPLTPGAAAAALRATRHSPQPVAAMAPAIARMAAAQPLYRRYPAEPSVRGLHAWSRAVAGLFGEEPDLR